MAMASDEEYYGNERQLKDRKGKNKMCNLNKENTDKLQERLDFKFSDFKALEVPKGWNKLFVSIISGATEKIIRKSGQALVQNGQCHWEDTMLNSLWISEDNALTDNEGCLLKLVVSMGSTRFGNLGEASMNLASYIRSETCTASLPLKHCTHGTILQVKIQCLLPRNKIRDEHRRDANSYTEEMNVDYDDVDNKSDVSDTFHKSVGLSYCTELDNEYHPGEYSSKEKSVLASSSHHGPFSFGTEEFPQQSDISGVKKNMNGRQESAHSKNGPYSFYDTSGSHYSSSASATSNSEMELQDQMGDCGRVLHATDTTSSRSIGSSKDLLDAAEVTIELLRAEAKMWKKQSQKLIADLERLQKDLRNQSKHQEDLEMELSALLKEQDGLKQEIEQPKIVLKESIVKQNDCQGVEFQTEAMDNILKELKDEIEYQKRQNDDLTMQLKETDDSNIKLVSILQELEETTEKQKTQIANLSMSCLHEDSEEEESYFSKQTLPEKMRNESIDSDLKLFTAEYPITCLHDGIELREFGT